MPRLMGYGFPGLLLAAAAVVVLTAQSFSFRGLALVVGTAATLGALWVERGRESAIPSVIRPGPVALASVTLAAIGSGALADEPLADYQTLWALQVAGIGVGLAAWQMWSNRRPPTSPALNRRRLSVLSFVAFGGALLMAGVYFATQGVPALGDELEQSRIDAAQGGSAFVRMPAFLTPTVAIMLVAILGRKAWPFALVSILFMIGVGNRNPIVYFVFPLIVLAAVVGKRIGSYKLVAAGALLLVLVGAAGAYRIATTEQFQYDALYMADIESGNYPSIAVTAVEHYAKVVPDNAVLVKDLVDEGAIERQWGATYVTLFTTLAPGHQTSPDMLIKEASGKEFIGGGIPPTAAGEGYMNFGYPGVVLNSAAILVLLAYWGARVGASSSHGRRSVEFRADAAIYGYVVTWCVMAQVSGLTGSATVSLAAFLVLVALRFTDASRWRSARTEKRVVSRTSSSGR